MQFGPAHECIKWFFEILREFTPAQQRAVLMFGNFIIKKKKANSILNSKRFSDVVFSTTVAWL